jgi:C4-dicarboxylate-specific signal transduction histidine kinase
MLDEVLKVFSKKTGAISAICLKERDSRLEYFLSCGKNIEYIDFNSVDSSNNFEIVKKDNRSFLILFLDGIVISFVYQNKNIDLQIIGNMLSSFTHKLNMSILACESFAKTNDLNKNLESKVNQQVQELRKKDNILIQQSRFAALGEMISNIAHQWRQPLTAISASAQNINFLRKSNKLSDEKLSEKVVDIISLSKQMSQTIDDFKNFFSPNKKKEQFNIKDSIEVDLNFVKNIFISNNITVDNSIKDNNIVVIGYKNELSQAILNILNNAKDVLKDKENRYINLSIDANYISRDLPMIKLMIRDSGGGVPSDIIDKIFDPYFTTKHKSHGTGIGLYMTKQIIQNMSGDIWVQNIEYNHNDTIYKGAEFNIILPKCIN